MSDKPGFMIKKFKTKVDISGTAECKEICADRKQENYL